MDSLQNATRNKWLSFQAAVCCFYYTPQALESQHIPEITFCCRPPGVFGGTAGRQQLVNTKVIIYFIKLNTEAEKE
ncbi:hypothetical protein B0S90_0178 [Caldicellulosiruptor bescii]|uniref:Uncharacterized protein n=1 Tax=Caldicellulosiruptor bescii TaxID=31899 RepID=A0ABY1S5E2_CALBS|nr:hypothetical protein B0S87_1448 [Caldicellulosiruptor bescii]PBC92061.1 hypothetical protein B0S89_2545 [Caldicellulosiruptor bescii]PBD02524.1 hypothetical protein B0S85_0031 [Caldicellulosiruptor bescii]PBD05241.1 hypothetical protein B0S90_0178 [Caldicellulosiruptor bescii]PBD07805.1 hypothetical protein B0S84_0082 [Caldicellulosiruptor bescii]